MNLLELFGLGRRNDGEGKDERRRIEEMRERARQLV